MFFYLSFLRPPPLQASLTGTIFITPQVTNDLRTEIFDRPQDIYYFWCQVSSLATTSNLKSAAAPAPINITTTTTTTKPSKLTTWRPTTAYKDIAVPLPQGVRVGQSWRLALSSAETSGKAHGHTINLKGDAMGATPFAVISMPILFVAESRQLLAKQDQIERIYRFPLSRDSDFQVDSLTIREHLSFDLDKKVWDSGVGLSSWLVDLKDGTSVLGVQAHGNSVMLTALQNALFSRERRRIIELGAGSGIVGLTLATLRSSVVPLYEDYVIMTDLASAMPLLEHNISANQRLFPTNPPHAAVLNWDEEIPDSTAATGGYDAIIMADVTYNTSSFPSLIRILSTLTRMDKSQRPLLLLGYKERDPAERMLWDMVRDIGVMFERVGERKGAGGASVEVWVGKIVDSETNQLDVTDICHDK